MVVRRNTRLAGVNSATATLMSRYGIPQMTDNARNSNHPRRVTARLTSWTSDPRFSRATYRAPSPRRGTG